MRSHVDAIGQSVVVGVDPPFGAQGHINMSVTVLPRRRRTPPEERAARSSNTSHTQSNAY